MSSSNPQHEPTMEEILASIRKIIAEDTNEPPAPRQEAQVIELTHEIEEEPAPVPVPSTPATEEASAMPVPRPTVDQAAVAPLQSIAEPEVTPETEAPTSGNEDTQMNSAAQTVSHEGIFSDRARQAIDDTFASLDEVRAPQKAQVPKAPSFPSVEGNSVEAVFERAVRASVNPVLEQWMGNHHDELLDAVKPLIRDWMDEHFPALLEGAVREEVARVVRARGR